VRSARLLLGLVLFHDPALGLHFKALGMASALPSLCGVRFHLPPRDDLLL